MIALARKTLIHEWRRFLPAVLAVGFSGVLLVVQAALVLGIFGSAAVAVTATSADLWAGASGTRSVNFGRSIGPDVEMRLRMDPEVIAVEPYLWVEGDWHGQDAAAGGVSVYVSGLRTGPEAMMFDHILSVGLRAKLREPGAVIVDRSDLAQLGVDVGQVAWINGQRVRLLAAVTGLRGLGGVNVLASIDTARRIEAGAGAGASEGEDAGAGAGAPGPGTGAWQSSAGDRPSPAGDAGPTYFVARLRDPSQADAVRARLQPAAAFGPAEVWTAADFAERSQRYWLLDTGAGVAVLFMAVIVCLVGGVVTSQSLTAVVVGSAREYAVLTALGASVFALSRVVLEQAFWVGLLGLVVAAAVSAVLLGVAAQHDVPVAISAPVAGSCAALVGGLALVSGLLAVRGLGRADPASLLR